MQNHKGKRNKWVQQWAEMRLLTVLSLALSFCLSRPTASYARIEKAQADVTDRQTIFATAQAKPLAGG